MAENTAPNGPGFIEANAHTAQVLRQLVQAIFVTPGVITSGDLKVTQNGTPNMSVNVAAGVCIVPGTTSAPTQGSYNVYNDAAVNKSIATADPTHGRIDIVVALIEDQQYSGTLNTWAITVVGGTPSSSPVQPATPANSLILAAIAVGAAVTSIVTANITDLRITANVVNTPGQLTARTRRAAAQSIPNNASTAVIFDTEDYDPSNMISGSTWTCPIAGHWSVKAGFSMAAPAAAAGIMFATINKNGSISASLGSANNTTTLGFQGSGALEDHFNVGDTVTVVVFQNSGAAVNTTATDARNFLAVALTDLD